VTSTNVIFHEQLLQIVFLLKEIKKNGHTQIHAVKESEEKGESADSPFHCVKV